VHQSDFEDELVETPGRDDLNGASQCWVAVGMPVARHPPHRSVLEELPHTAPTSGNDANTHQRIKDGTRLDVSAQAHWTCWGSGLTNDSAEKPPIHEN